MTDLLGISQSLPAFEWSLLVAASFFTSMITAVFGIGGGITLLAGMAQLLPAVAVIPIHGAVQAGSNLGRAGLLLQHIRWSFISAFALGAAMGGLIGGSIVVTLPTAILQAALGAFILFVVWGPGIPAWASGQMGVVFQGVLSTILTFFVGATGPFIAAALKPHQLNAMAHVATFAAAMSLQHLLKIVVFAVLGFQYGPYIGLMVSMLATGLLGTLVGTKILSKRTNTSFQRWLNIILTLLGLRLLFLSISATL